MHVYNAYNSLYTIIVALAIYILNMQLLPSPSIFKHCFYSVVIPIFIYSYHPA